MCGPFALALCALAALAAGAEAAPGEAAGPRVRTPHGALSGAWKTSAAGRSYASFQGIPYASPPVGEDRFREPQHLKPWEGVRDASSPGSLCLQYNPFSDDIKGSENCLFLNVYTPQVSGDARLPVIVYIHGGAFMYGESSGYGPQYIMDRDVVVVTMNYRLGPLGFLSTNDGVVPGNMGLKDQSYALHWVQNNIMVFGGNPDNVTLTGQSAGGASVHYHYLSPLSRGTFARGIAFSGSAFSSWTNAAKPAEKARGLAAHVGCPTTSSREMVECLRNKPAESIVQAQSIYFDWKVHMFTVFTPTVEPAASREPFISQQPYQLMQSGQMARVPLIMSVTSEEGLYPAATYQHNPELLPELEAHWKHLASEIFVYNDTLPLAQRRAVANKIKMQYLQGKPVSQETFPQLVQALGDRLFMADVGKTAQLHAALSGQPVHVYHYSFRGEKSLSNPMAGNHVDYGVSHADDVLHFWRNKNMEMDKPADQQMTQLMVDLVYSFASTGTPRAAGVAWSPLEAGSPELRYLEISAPGRAAMRASADFGHRAFWDSLGFLENENALVMGDE